MDQSTYDTVMIVGGTLGFTFTVAVPFIVRTLSRIQKLESKWEAHLESDDKTHDGIRGDIADMAMESTRQHGELKNALEALTKSAEDGRRTLHGDVNDLREKSGELKGSLDIIRSLLEAKFGPSRNAK